MIYSCVRLVNKAQIIIMITASLKNSIAYCLICKGCSIMENLYLNFGYVFVANANIKHGPNSIMRSHRDCSRKCLICSCESQYEQLICISWLEQLQASKKFVPTLPVIVPNQPHHGHWTMKPNLAYSNQCIH